MSLLTIQLGQCGNQLGEQLLRLTADETLGTHAPFDSQNLFFREDRNGHQLARAVLLDMEPKVVQTCLDRRGGGTQWSYNAHNALVQQSGSGNNWALGYQTHGDRHIDAAVELVRREAEHCDSLAGLLLLQSLAGGTGAGFGTRMSEELKDHMSGSLCLSCAVWPYGCGEVVVQPYNTLLSLRCLLDACDGVVLLQNDELHATCVNVHKQQRPAFSDLNAVAAHTLAALLCPANLRHDAAVDAALTGSASAHPPRSSSKGSPKDPGSHCHGTKGRRAARESGGSRNAPHVLAQAPASLGRRLHLGDILTQVASHPAYQILSARCCPMVDTAALKYTSFQWDAILKRALQMFVTRSTCPERLDWSVHVEHGHVAQGYRGSTNRCAGSFAVCRGLYAAQVDTSALAHPSLYPGWVTRPLRTAAAVSSFQQYEMSCTMLSADQACISPVRSALAKCSSMLQAGVYVHQYEQHGLSKDELWDAAACAAEVVAAYEAL